VTAEIRDIGDLGTWDDYLPSGARSIDWSFCELESTGDDVIDESNREIAARELEGFPSSSIVAIGRREGLYLSQQGSGAFMTFNALDERIKRDTILDEAHYETKRGEAVRAAIRDSARRVLIPYAPEDWDNMVFEAAEMEGDVQLDSSHIPTEDIWEIMKDLELLDPDDLMDNSSYESEDTFSEADHAQYEELIKADTQMRHQYQLMSEMNPESTDEIRNHFEEVRKEILALKKAIAYRLPVPLPGPFEGQELLPLDEFQREIEQGDEHKLALDEAKERAIQRHIDSILEDLSNIPAEDFLEDDLQVFMSTRSGIRLS
jgi:hypothetical protein